MDSIEKLTPSKRPCLSMYCAFLNFNSKQLPETQLYREVIYKQTLFFADINSMLDVLLSFRHKQYRKYK